MSFELTSTAELLALWAVAGYLLGAIPFGIVTVRLLGLGFTKDWLRQYRGYECAAHRLETWCGFNLNR